MDESKHNLIGDNLFAINKREKKELQFSCLLIYIPSFWGSLALLFISTILFVFSVHAYNNQNTLEFSLLSGCFASTITGVILLVFSSLKAVTLHRLSTEKKWLSEYANFTKETWDFYRKYIVPLEHFDPENDMISEFFTIMYGLWHKLNSDIFPITKKPMTEWIHHCGYMEVEDIRGLISQVYDLNRDYAIVTNDEQEIQNIVEQLSAKLVFVQAAINHRIEINKRKNEIIHNSIL